MHRTPLIQHPGAVHRIDRLLQHPFSTEVLQPSQAKMVARTTTLHDLIEMGEGLMLHQTKFRRKILTTLCPAKGGARSMAVQTKFKAVKTLKTHKSATESGKAWNFRSEPRLPGPCSVSLLTIQLRTRPAAVRGGRDSPCHS